MTIRYVTGTVSTVARTTKAYGFPRAISVHWSSQLSSIVCDCRLTTYAATAPMNVPARRKAPI